MHKLEGQLPGPVASFCFTSGKSSPNHHGGCNFRTSCSSQCRTLLGKQIDPVLNILSDIVSSNMARHAHAQLTSVWCPLLQSKCSAPQSPRAKLNNKAVFPQFQHMRATKKRCGHTSKNHVHELWQVFPIKLTRMGTSRLHETSQSLCSVRCKKSKR